MYIILSAYDIRRKLIFPKHWCKLDFCLFKFIYLILCVSAISNVLADIVETSFQQECKKEYTLNVICLQCVIFIRNRCLYSLSNSFFHE